MTTDVPETRYARCGELFIAYQVFGKGPPDIVQVPGFVWNLEHQWEWPAHAAMLRRLASIGRVIVLDKRGTGLSDRMPPDRMPGLEERMDDLTAVLDAAGVERATLIGHWEGGPMCALFAATYPERTERLILHAPPAVFRRDEDYPWAASDEERERIIEMFAEGWGQGNLRHVLCPSLAGDELVARWWAKMERVGASPGAAISLLRINAEIDVRPILPTIRVPTLVTHSRGDRVLDVAAGRYVAERIPGARFVELDGSDHLAFVADPEGYAGEVEEFVTGTRSGGEIDRVLATILFVDIVDSTARAEALGDRAWAELLDRFHEVSAAEVARFRGRVVDTAGDGFFATFDGPARAIRCAIAVRARAGEIGLEIRAGLHTGECEVSSDGRKVAGIAVHVGARIAASAAPGVIVVSSTVRDLVAGSRLAFDPVGVRELKGVRGEWTLLEVREDAA